VWGSMKEWTLTLSRQLPLWEMESRWTSETSESNFRGKNSISCGVLYIIGKLLELKCLKWARIAHLDIWNTSYGQKKGRESNCQFDSRPEKVGNWFDLLGCRGHGKYYWKVLDESYNFASNHIFDPRSAHKIMGLQSCRNLNWRDFGIATRESRERKAIWMWALWPATKYIIRGKVVASPKFGLWWVYCVHVTRAPTMH